MPSESSTPARIYLARHGKSMWNECGRIAGQLDPPLSALGRRQARSLAAVLREAAIDAVYSSSLLRARETALPTATPIG